LRLIIVILFFIAFLNITYVARHSFASVLKKSGVNIALISEALGHSDLATTQIYLDSFDNEQVDEAMKNLL
ncbi:tyrosine-type recombinase/integrase, partial [Phocaeicola sp.]|uniref:tyrosine-type recombinase/integrase n=1 Tax=Phocaeicola sp. TaxID=2773926 RepID=UPI002A81F551